MINTTTNKDSSQDTGKPFFFAGGPLNEERLQMWGLELFQGLGPTKPLSKSSDRVYSCGSTPTETSGTQSVYVATHVISIVPSIINCVQYVQSIITSQGIVLLEVNTKVVPARWLKLFLSNWEHLTKK